MLLVDLAGSALAQGGNPEQSPIREHLLYTSPAPKGRLFLIEQPFSFPLLYLASGVATARTAGAIEPSTDLELKRNNDVTKAIGPELELTRTLSGGLASADRSDARLKRA
jgi:hypothetical protein